MNNLLTAYVAWVRQMPIVSAMIQFAILGTFGEIISRWLKAKKIHYPFSTWLTLWKMVVWAILAIGIKYAFKGFEGCVEYLELHSYLPQLSTFGKAFAISAFMNTSFGLTLMFGHRILDNVFEKKINWANIDKSCYSLLWFWIPAHTVTFMLPELYRIGLAALWSVVLGVILGLFSQK